MRQVSRVLLLNEHDQILLLKGGDPYDKSLGSWWFTPGGGVEGNESHEAAASRELWEETGLELEISGPALWERDARFEFMGDSYNQRESFFVARTTHFEPSAKLLTNVEQESIQGWKWWSKQELVTTKEQIYPEDLGQRFEDLFLESLGKPIVLPAQEFELPKRSAE